jgi:hypothetical protein
MADFANYDSILTFYNGKFLFSVLMSLLFARALSERTNRYLLLSVEGKRDKSWTQYGLS